MEIKKKKIRKSVSFVLCMIMILSTTMNAFAGTFPLKWTKLSSAYDKTFTFKGDSYKTTAGMEKFTLDGETAFCLECGRKIDGYTGNDTGSITAEYARDTATKDSKQNKIAYLGYYSTSKSNKDYAFTQMYILQSLPDMTYSGNDTVVFTNASTKSEYATWKKGIDAKIATWNTIPSFDSIKYDKVLSLKSGESKTITDSNGVLEDYSAFTYTKGGVSVKHTAGSNTMTYSATASTKTGSVIMTNANLKGAGCQKYTSESVANYVYNSDDDQNMGAYGAVDPLGLNLEFNVTSPTVGTSAIDGETNENVARPDGSVTIIDTVSYKGVIAGKEYMLSGTLMDKATGNPILVGGNKVTATKTFTPAAASGSVDVTFKFDGSSLAGKTIVVFETLTLGTTEVASHEDISDVDQTVYFPSIGTSAVDGKTTEHLAKPDKEASIVDTVSYTNLVTGKEYVVSGKLIDKESGAPLLIDGKEVTATKSFTPSTPNGSVDVVFNFDASSLAGKTLVVFETVTRNGHTVATHTDINDTNQTIYFPEIGTTALDTDTKDHISYADDEITLVDSVKYENLIAGKEYKVAGTLMDRETGEALLVNDLPVTAETTFTPEETSGTVDVTFVFDGTGLEGKTLVAFETLTVNDKELAVHADIEDTEQTVVIPKVGTTALDSDTKNHISFADKEITIVDSVKYENLIAGKEYKVAGTLMDKATGKALLVNDLPVVAEATFTPEEANGTVDVTFIFDGTGLEGKTVVAYETVTKDDITVATHTDIEDEEQSVVIPKIGTTAARQGDKITDTIKYENLIPGLTYKVTGTLMDKATGKPMKLDGKVITVTKEFTPKEASGTVEVTFNIDSVKLAGKTAVVFEEMALDGKTVAEHKDINDKGQTVVIPELPKEYPDTGDKGMLAVWILLAGASLVIAGRVVSAKKRNKEKE